MKEIICKNGERIQVDDEDYDFLSRFTWYMGSELNAEGGGYACCFIYGKKNTRKQIFMHQLIMAGFMADHEDRNKRNNQKYNLRVATHQFNGWNKGKPRACRHGTPTSQYKGVSYRPLRGKDRWLAMIKHVEAGKHKTSGKMIYIGYFDTEVEAARAYNGKVVELRGKWAWQNPVPEVA